MQSLVKSFLCVLACLTACCLAAVHPQQPGQSPTSEGVALYEQRDMEGAIKVLKEAVTKSKDDSIAWHYLGLALAQQGDTKEAVKALGKAIDLKARAVGLEFRANEEWRDDRLASLRKLLSEHIQTQKALEKLTEQLAVGKGQLALERSRVLADCVEQSVRLIDGHLTLKKIDLRMEKARVLSKPNPMFTNEARLARASGNVVLRAIFAADGSVQFIEPIRSAGYGMTEESIRAASAIRFRPESICGNPVSSPIQLEYQFHASW